MLHFQPSSLPRCDPVTTFEQPVEVGQVLKPALSGNGQDGIIRSAQRGCCWNDLADYAAIQINDTHPSMVVPELIRLPHKCKAGLLHEVSCSSPALSCLSVLLPDHSARWIQIWVP